MMGFGLKVMIELTNQTNEKIRYEVGCFRQQNKKMPIIKSDKKTFIDFIDQYARWYTGDGQVVNEIRIKINEDEIESFKNEMINEPYLLVDGIKIKVVFLED